MNLKGWPFVPLGDPGAVPLGGDGPGNGHPG